MTQRITQTFANRKNKGQAAFVAYIIGGATNSCEGTDTENGKAY